MSTSISDKAMLVKLGVSQWSAERKDRAVEEHIAQHYGTKKKAGRFTKYLIDPDDPYLTKIRNAASAAYTTHVNMTLPWNDDGTRVLPAAMYFDYTRKVGEQISAFNTAVDVFIPVYPKIQAQAEIDQNGLFRQADWPTVEALKTKFGIRRQIFPLADQSDFRVQLGAEHDELIRKECEQAIYGKLTSGLHDLYSRLRTVVDQFIERVEPFEVDARGKSVHTFRDSAVTNIRELLEIVPKLNVMNDPGLKQMAESIGQLCSKDAQDLRDDFVVRKQAVEHAKEVAAKLAQIDEFLGSQSEAA